MKRFTVVIERTSIREVTIEISAENEHDARRRAEENEGNINFNNGRETHSEYSVVSVREK